MRRSKIIRDRSNFDVSKTQDFLQRPDLFRNAASEVGDAIFPDIYEYYSIKESIALQLVCNLKVLLIGDSGCSKSSFLSRIKENFNFVECIPHYCGGDLPTDKSVLAFTVPKQGRFDTNKTIIEQIGIESFFLNQFDVLFIMRDMPNKERDRKVAEKIIKGEKKIDLKDVRKKISKLRGIKSIWSEEAERRMIDFYVSLRNQKVRKDISVVPIPINSKGLAFLKKIAEGYTKLRESKEVSEEDARNAIKLFKDYTMQLNEVEDEDG